MLHSVCCKTWLYWLIQPNKENDDNPIDTNILSMIYYIDCRNLQNIVRYQYYPLYTVQNLIINNLKINTKHYLVKYLSQ